MAIFTQAYDTAAAVFIIVDALVLFGIIYSLISSWHYRPNYKGHAHGPAVHHETLKDAVMKERWGAIMTKFGVGTPEAMRLAIIEADAFVDTALKGRRIPGEHLADRLSNLETQDIASMNRMWRAHRMRNDLVHTTGFTITPPDAARTMSDYEAFLREIEVIE